MAWRCEKKAPGYKTRLFLFSPTLDAGVEGGFFFAPTGSTGHVFASMHAIQKRGVFFSFRELLQIVVGALLLRLRYVFVVCLFVCMFVCLLFLFAASRRLI